MSQPPDAPEPYLPQQPDQRPGPQQPYPPQQAWAGASSLTGGRSRDDIRRDRPTTAVRLVQLMGAGVVLAVLSGDYGLLSLDSAMAEVVPQVEQDLAASGLDADAFTGVAGSVAVAGVIVTTLVVAGLWALFAWLFGRGQGRVVGTVLGAINGVAILGGLFVTLDLLELLLQLVTLAVIVGAMVLLWLPETSTRFRTVKAADRSISWT